MAKLNVREAKTHLSEWLDRRERGEEEVIGEAPARHLHVPVERRRRHCRRARGIEPLALDEEAALHLARLPPVHRDPFDRMLVCQALVAGLTMVTPDLDFARYPVRTLW